MAEDADARPPAPSPLVDLLPRDLLVLVLARLDFASAERLLATCTALRTRGGGDEGDGLYRRVAVERWGAAFWERALTRRTWRHHTSMRDELRSIAQFERRLATVGAPLWSEADYRRLWDYEELVAKDRLRRAALARGGAARWRVLGAAGPP